MSAHNHLQIAEANSLAASLDKYVGHLRAYATIASGCKQTADRALLKICNQLVDSKADFRVEPSFDYRTFLFSLAEEQISESVLATKALDQKLFMLVAIEGVSSSDAAHILGLDQTFIERWIAEILR
jgi:hypothetical protein